MREYAHMLADPFDVNRLSCLPVYPALPSYKTIGISRGVFSIGKKGFGYITARRVTTNDDICIIASNNDYDKEVIDHDAGGIQQYNCNLPYAVGDYGGNGKLESRVVGYALRVRYVGTELNRGGLIVGINEPHGHELAGKSFSDLQLYDKVSSMPVDRKWKYVVWQPTALNTPGYINDHIVTPYNSAFCLRGLPENEYEYEYVVRVEYIGQNARGKTPSGAAPALFERVTAYMMNMNMADIQRLYSVGVSAHRFLTSAHATPQLMYR